MWAAAAAAALTAASVVGTAAASPKADTHGHAASTATPIQHLVVIYQENVSFDHYFGTYPFAANTDGTKFVAAPNTPSVNGLSSALLQHNPNAANPQRLSSSQAITCDQNHNYGAEQKAADGGLMDMFVQYANKDTCAPPAVSVPNVGMDYYDGNTVTGLWNYAQHFAMSDNSFSTTFGPSTPGVLNLVSGQTHGGYAVTPSGQKVNDPSVVSSPDANGVGTVINDPDPAFDDCANSSNHLAMTGPNIGDLLNKQNVTWGWFQGGFQPTSTNTGKSVCGSTHTNIGGTKVTDYSPHHNPFEYYQSTSNPHHLPPTSVPAIGHTDQANHQYDLTNFNSALQAGNLPAVSFLKAASYQDGHAGYSNPIDEQKFLATTVNALQKSKDWKSTAVVIAYDDSDGWYDHVMPPIVNASHDATASGDALNGAGVCGSGTPMGGYQNRCGYGPRQPLLVISPFAKTNYVDHSITDQTSILKFIEDNWGTGRIGNSSFDQLAGSLNNMLDFKGRPAAPLFLDPASGQPKHS
ncbi:phospholipase C [Streptomyces sp. NPDC000880]